jgi:hypothetical protein
MQLLENNGNYFLFLYGYLNWIEHGIRMRDIKKDIVKVRYEIKVTTKIFSRNCSILCINLKQCTPKPYDVSQKCRSLVMLPFTKATEERTTLN